MATYPDPLDLKKAKTVTMPDGRVEKATKFLKSGSTLKESFYKDIPNPPELFKAKEKTTKKGEKIKGSYALNNKYVFTSGDLTNHEDFTSYYPNMLRMLDAFYNEGLGYDRYAEIFDDKQKYGDLMKDKTYSEAERGDFSLLREGTKLILNSASGAADANYDTPIRMNNMIMSMRIIG
jgi:ADP-heptose:LPS heptosyltransferase